MSLPSPIELDFTSRSDIEKIQKEVDDVRTYVTKITIDEFALQRDEAYDKLLFSIMRCQNLKTFGCWDCLNLPDQTRRTIEKKIKRDNGFVVDCKRCGLYGKQPWICSRGDRWSQANINQIIGRRLRMEQNEKEKKEEHNPGPQDFVIQAMAYNILRVDANLPGLSYSASTGAPSDMARITFSNPIID